MQTPNLVEELHLFLLYMKYYYNKTNKILKIQSPNQLVIIANLNLRNPSKYKTLVIQLLHIFPLHPNILIPSNAKQNMTKDVSNLSQVS